MSSTEIGLWVTGGLFVMVVLGMRVAFAAGIAGVVGLIWIFWDKKQYAMDQFGWALGVAVKTAGQVPHSKIASQELSLIPVFILIGYMAYYAGLTTALFALGDPGDLCDHRGTGRGQAAAGGFRAGHVLGRGLWHADRGAGADDPEFRPARWRLHLGRAV